MEYNIATILGLALLGITAGILSGMFGIGGGLVIIPALVLIFGLGQHTAQGTSLALMLPPLGLLAALEYSKNKHVEWWAAAIICVGLFLGAYFGSLIANRVITDPLWMKRIFGILLIVVAVRMIFFSK